MNEERQWLQELKKAKYSGALRVRQGDKEITYRSQAEIDQAIATLERKLEPAGPSRTHLYTDKGL